jgi:3-oxoacyl-[acyl-carrier protein] reductase
MSIIHGARDKIVVVTGAAGGIGNAICRTFASLGSHVVVGYNTSKENAEALLLQLENGPHLALKAPVDNSAGMNELAESVKRELGNADILINAAGTTRFVEHSDLKSLDDELIDQIFRVNVRGVISATRAFQHQLSQSGNGVIVNISSIAAVTGMGSNIAYCASKAAVDNLTKSLARALAPAIRVVSVSPGLVDTEFVRGLDQNWRDQQASRTLQKRLATPKEVADAVIAATLLLPFTTGAVIPVDGGRQLA